MIENVRIERKLILTEKPKRYRVPHCSECERCQCTDFIYKDYYLVREMIQLQRFGSLGADHPPKTSSKWCPKRKGVK